MFLHDTLFSAFIVSTLGGSGGGGGIGGGCTTPIPQQSQQPPQDSMSAESAGESPPVNPRTSTTSATPHLMLFFDVAPPDVHSQLPLISEIVSAEVLKRLGVQWSGVESPSASGSSFTDARMGTSGGGMGGGGRESSRPAPDFIPIYRRDKESSTSSLTS